MSLRGAATAVLPALLLLAGWMVRPASADQSYSAQVFFENSLSPVSYFYSSGRLTAPSQLELVDGRLPVEQESFISAPNALSLRWRSMPQGGWSVELRLYAWRNRTLEFPGDSLWIWVCAPEGLRARQMPRIALRDAGGNFSLPYDVDGSGNFAVPLDLAAYAPDLAPGRWTRLRIPLRAFRTASLHPLEPHRLTRIILSQGVADGAPHTLLVDDIRIENQPAHAQAPPAPGRVRARGYERHIDVTWDPVEDRDLAQYVIYRSMGGGPYRPVGVERPGVERFADYLGDPHATASYRVSARTSGLLESPQSPPATASTRPMTDEELMDMVEEASFRYSWEAAEPNSGMTRESTPGNDDIIAVGASGFGILAVVAAADRGYIPRVQALDRLLRVTGFLERAQRFHGAWPHFLSGRTARALPVFQMYDDGADLVETSFLMQGLLTARQYFRGDGVRGRELYDRITRLWEGVEWDWFESPRRDALYWHWSPEYSFHIALRLTGWNEVMITYLEAMASPTHGIPASLYYSGFAGETIDAAYANGKSFYGIELPVGGPGAGGPLFFTHYSFFGLDPHAWRDRYTGYFENNRSQALINRAYCMENPHHWKGYGAAAWGLTAVDGPGGYVPYEPTPRLGVCRTIGV